MNILMTGMVSDVIFMSHFLEVCLFPVAAMSRLLLATFSILYLCRAFTFRDLREDRGFHEARDLELETVLDVELEPELESELVSELESKLELEQDEEEDDSLLAERTVQAGTWEVDTCGLKATLLLVAWLGVALT
jgi:hypothetical protein